MKTYVRRIWAAVYAAWISMSGTLTAFATEQGTEPVEKSASGFMLTMEVLQKVCFVIVIVVAITLLAFYLVKMVLKRLYVPEVEQKQNDKE